MLDIFFGEYSQKIQNKSRSTKEPVLQQYSERNPINQKIIYRGIVTICQSSIEGNLHEQTTKKRIFGISGVIRFPSVKGGEKVIPTLQ